MIYGEWEVLTVFAAYLGPAEVTAWAILGSLWDIFESSSEGIGGAAEVRVAYNLGKRRSDQARISAYKSNVIGILFSIVLSVIFLALGNQIPQWLTSDLTLQRMVGDNIPLLCIGNIIMTAGSVCWAEIGAQGRYKLATIIYFVSSWFVTIPLAAISVYYLTLDLRGMIASVCIGYFCACTALAYVVLQSDWDRLAQKVAGINAVAAVTGQLSKNMLDQHEDDDWEELPVWIREAASVCYQSQWNEFVSLIVIMSHKHSMSRIDTSFFSLFFLFPIYEYDIFQHCIGIRIHEKNVGQRYGTLHL